MPPSPINPADGLRPIPQLAAFWSRRVEGGQRPGADAPLDWAVDQVIIHGLGLGLQETLDHLLSRRPGFDAFLDWIVERNGGVIAPERLDRLNAMLAQALGHTAPVAAAPPAGFEPVLGDDERRHWDEHGYVVLRRAVSPAACHAAERALWQFLEMEPNQPDTWYRGDKRRGIMVPLIHHPAFDANRRAPRIRAAFAQLWGTDDLQVTVDGGGFNPPERPDARFSGAGPHWDTSLVPPIPLRIQAVLYLTDTPAEQGAFHCVPGFHRRIDSWLASLPPGADPRAHDFNAQAVAVAGEAGDLVLWHAALPHGASPNRGRAPRLVQYIAYYPPGLVDRRPWR